MFCQAVKRFCILVRKYTLIRKLAMQCSTGRLFYKIPPDSTISLLTKIHGSRAWAAYFDHTILRKQNVQ